MITKIEDFDQQEAELVKDLQASIDKTQAVIAEAENKIAAISKHHSLEYVDSVLGEDALPHIDAIRKMLVVKAEQAAKSES